VYVPGRLTSGEVDKIEVLIGPSSQLVSEPVEEYGPDIEDDPTVAELQNRTDRIDALPAGE
jgi:hypothetical protein